MFQHFQTKDMEHSMMEFTDVLALELKGGNLRAFDTEWDNTLLGVKEVPDEKYLENLYRTQVKSQNNLKYSSLN